MHRLRSHACACATAAAFLIAGTPASGQSYPAKPIRLIAPFPPGGGIDATARIIGQALAEAFGQQVVIDNRGGASGRIGTELAARTAPDGYTLLLGSVAPNAIVPAVYPKLPYDAVADFAPISLVAESDYILAVHPSLPVHSVKDLIALARARPKEIAYASTGILGGPHLAGELFKLLAKVDMVHVAYKGGGPATTAILGGEVSLIFGTGPTVVPHAKAGRMRLVATSGPKRSRTHPELPTVAETLPGHDVTQWYGLLAPAGTSPEIITRIATEIAKSVRSTKVAQQFAALGAEPASSTPQEFSAHIKSEIAKWRRVVSSANITAE